MATSVTTETLNGDLCKLPPDPGKSPGPWKRSKEDGNQPLSFRDALMQVQHKGSYYLEISEPESEGFKSDEWEEDEQQIHNQGPSNCPLVININGETYRYLSHSLYSWIRAEIFLSYHIVRKTIQTNIYGQGIPIMESFIVHIVTLTQPKGSF